MSFFSSSYFGGGIVGGGSPLVVSGRIIGPLIIGDDYLAANGRSLQWTVDKPSGPAATSCVLRFVQSSGACTPVELEIAGSVSDTGTQYLLTFSITKTQSNTLAAGEYSFFVILTTSSGEEITVVYNRQLVQWKQKAA